MVEYMERRVGITGIEEPQQLAAAMPMVERAFVFVDLCGFTAFMAANGEHAAINALTSFRNLTRDGRLRRVQQLGLAPGTELPPITSWRAAERDFPDSGDLA